MNTYAPAYDATQPNVPAAVLAGIIVGALVVLVIAGTAVSYWNTRRNRWHPTGRPDLDAAIAAEENAIREAREKLRTPR